MIESAATSAPARAPPALRLVPARAAAGVRKSEHGERVLARVGAQEEAAVARHVHLDGRRADPLPPLHGERALDGEVPQVDHGDQVLLRDRHVGAVELRIGGDRLGMRKVRANLDVLHLRGGGEVDHRHRAVGLVRHQPVLPVARDRRAVRVAADLYVARPPRRGVDDRRVVGQVEGGEQRLPVARHGEVARPGSTRRLGRREGLRERRVTGRRHRDRARPARPARARVVAEHVDHVALLAGRAGRGLLILVRRLRDSGHVGGAAVARHRDAAAEPRHRQHLHHAAHGTAGPLHAPLVAALATRARVARRLPAPPAGRHAHDAHVVSPASRRQRPVEAATRRERAAARMVTRPA